MNAQNRGLWITFAALALVVLLGPLLVGGLLGAPAMGSGIMGPGMMGPGMLGSSGPMGMAGGWGWGLAMGLGSLIMLAFWGVVIVGGVLLARWALAGGRPSMPAEDEALTILRRRYASGELSQAQYEQLRHDLTG
jgi:putative membrane protein